MSKFEELKQIAESALQTKDSKAVWCAYGAAAYCYGEKLISGDEMFVLAQMLIVNNASITF